MDLMHSVYNAAMCNTIVVSFSFTFLLDADNIKKTHLYISPRAGIKDDGSVVDETFHETNGAGLTPLPWYNFLLPEQLSQYVA